MAQLDLSTLKLKNRDMVDFQRVVGKPISAAFVPGQPEDWTAITALVWILKRRQDPGFTFDDALDMDIDDEGFAALVPPTTPAETSAGAAEVRSTS